MACSGVCVLPALLSLWRTYLWKSVREPQSSSQNADQEKHSIQREDVTGEVLSDYIAYCTAVDGRKS